MLSREYFEPLLLIIAQELLVQSQVRASDVIIYISANTYETSHNENVAILTRILLILTILRHIQI